MLLSPPHRTGILVVLTAALATASACTGQAPLGEEEGAPAPRAPSITTALNRTFPTNEGLLRSLGHNGWPLTDGETMDPAILESRRFYDTVAAFTLPGERASSPDQAGLSAGPAGSSPMTLDAWKKKFSLPDRLSGESLQDYRDRVGVAVYYNKNELGLGRELGCAQFDDGQDAAGNPAKGIACYVTNYGLTFRDGRNSLQLAIEGEHPKNTVCITYRPSMGPGYEVQFYVYGPQGQRLDWAQLDTLGPRANPHVCMNCHGGTYDEEHHMAKYARFLPLDPNVVMFAEGAGVPASLTRPGQEERIRKLNSYSLLTPITEGQREMLSELYGGAPEIPGAISHTTWQPKAWQDSEEHRQVFDKVLKPYCITCHLAMEQGLDGGALASYDIFRTPGQFRSFPAYVSVCDRFGMPNAQTTMVNFWEAGAQPVEVQGKTHATAADALLAFYGRDRSQCTNLDTVSDCNRGPDPDANCGNPFSGTGCVRTTGRCMPHRGPAVLTDPYAPVGVCKMDGSRGCQYPMLCRPATTRLPGLESFDGECVRCGFGDLPACPQSLSM
jgi:hypothetical protein